MRRDRQEISSGVSVRFRHRPGYETLPMLKGHGLLCCFVVVKDCQKGYEDAHFSTF